MKTDITATPMWQTLHSIELCKLLTFHRLGLVMIAACPISNIAASFAESEIVVQSPLIPSVSIVSPVANAFTPNLARSDFGTVSPLDHPEIAHTFTLHNDTPRPLTVTQAQPSCSCTHATLTIGTTTALARQGAEKVPTLPPLAPGQQITVCVSIDPAQLTPGPIAKSVALFVQGQTQPAAVLQMTATLLPVLTYDTAYLDFRKTSPAQAPPQRLTVSLDTRLAPSDRWPVLTASDSDLQITALPVEKKPHSPSPTPKYRQRTYLLRLSPHAAIGPIQGTVSFVPSPGAAVWPEEASLLQMAPPVLLLGEVTGDLAASPASLTFGTVPPGQTQTRTVALTRANGRPLPSFQVTSGSPWLTVQGTAKGVGGELDVTLNPATPIGPLHSVLTVTFTNGERVTVPTSAYVESRSAP